MNQDQLQKKLTTTYEAYRHDLRDIADHPELDTAEKLQKAQAHYRVFTDTVRNVATRWSEALDTKATDLEKVLYHGGDSYRQAVRQLSDKNPAELEEAAKIASRTGDSEMARAAAVVAREKGNHQIFYDFVQDLDEFSETYEELMQIPPVEEREQFVRQFIPNPPQPHDLRPSQEELQRRRDEQVQEQARRLQGEAAANAAARLTLNEPTQRPRRFVGRSTGGDAA